MDRWPRIRNNRAIILISLVFCGLAAMSGCAVNPVTGQSELMLVSETQEMQMGNEMYPNALWGAEGGGGEYRDELLKTYLKDMVVNIQRVSHRPNLPVTFAIQNSSVPNAWAIPGHVVMTRGLLAGLESEAEFAYVMGHEVGHVSARHSARQMSYGMVQQILLAGGGAALGGGAASNLALSLGSLGGNLILLKYSRSDELEADRWESSICQRSVITRRMPSAPRRMWSVLPMNTCGLWGRVPRRGAFSQTCSPPIRGRRRGSRRCRALSTPRRSHP